MQCWAAEHQWRASRVLVQDACAVNAGLDSPGICDQGHMLLSWITLWLERMLRQDCQRQSAFPCMGRGHAYGACMTAWPGPGRGGAERRILSLHLGCRFQCELPEWAGAGNAVSAAPRPLSQLCSHGLSAAPFLCAPLTPCVYFACRCALCKVPATTAGLCPCVLMTPCCLQLLCQWLHVMPAVLVSSTDSVAMGPGPRPQ